MAEFLPPVIFEIQANATKAIAQMQAVNGELDKMETKAIKAGGSLDVMTKASKFAGTALLGIAGVLGTVAAVSIKSALSVQESQAKLSTAVKNTGVSFQTFIPYMEKAQESMAQFGFGAEDTNQALAAMTAATRNPQTAINNLGVVADLAAFKNESLAAAADTVSRATMGQARGLADLGLAIGKTIPKGADLATITKMIEDRVKGSAAAAAKADPWKVLTTQFQLMAEKLGTALLPAFEKLTNWITKDGLPALKSIGSWISNNKGLFEFLAGALATIWAIPKVTAIIAALTELSAAYQALGVSAEAAAAGESAAAAFGGSAILGGSAPSGLIGAGSAIAGAGLSAGAGGLIGKGAPMVGGALGIHNTGVIRAGGSAAGAGTGALVGASVGSIVPVVGTAIGAVVGTIAGGLMGYFESNSGTAKITKAASKVAGNINSGKSPVIIPTTTKSKAAKGTTLAQQKAGIMGGGGALTLTVTTDSGAVVKSITGSAGTTKVVVKK